MAKGKSRPIIVHLKLLLAVLAVLPSNTESQKCAGTVSTVKTPDTATGTVNLTCEVPPQHVLPEEEFQWEWDELGPDGSIDNTLPNTTDTIYEVGLSIYPLPVYCNRTGFYKAFYEDANNTCIYSCLFLVEVEEVRNDVLEQEFSAYPIQTDLPYPSAPVDSTTTTTLSEGSTVSVGTCSTKYFLSSGCVLLDIMGQWYKDGEPLFPLQNRGDYAVTSSGELRIRMLSNTTAGYYVCITTLNNGLGSYRTVDTNIALAIPEPSTSPSPTASTSTDSSEESGLPVRWQIIVIAVNVIIVIGLLIIIPLVTACVCTAVWRKRTSKEQRRRARAKMTASYTRRKRPKSMAEHLQLEESDVETVDFGGPTEVPFDCILFEELLHKGAFKIVHHAVVNYPERGMMGVPVAVKRLKDDKSELGMEELMAEAYMLRAIHEKTGSHPHLVSLLGTTTDGGPTCLLLEYMPHGCLDEFLLSLREGPTPDWYLNFLRETLRGAYHKHISGDLMSVLVQVADGMNFLTEHGFIHRDLSTRNILIGDRLNVKIANPGMHHEGYYYVVTEREYVLEDMAPECLWEKCHSICSDVWSFGILAYRVVTLESEPYPDVTVDELYNRIAGGERPQLLASFSNELYFLLQRCWQFVAVERPSFATILSDLNDMSAKPTRHILLKATDDPKTPGYIDNKGQVFLKLVSMDTIEEHGTVLKKLRRNSMTQRSLSLISSIDDTVYTRETTETVFDFTQSDTDNDATTQGYDEHLKGVVGHTAAAAGVESSDTSNGKEKARAQDDQESAGKGKRRKKKRPSSGKKADVSNLVHNTSSNNLLSVAVPNSTKIVKMNPLRNSWESEGDGGVSSNDAPSITEEELEERNRDLSDQSDQSRDGSLENLIVHEI